MPTSRPATRAAQNESVFRELNEQLEAASSREPSDVSGFVCECADLACTTVLAVELREYERIRSHPTWFVVAPDAAHVDPTVERVVERAQAYWVVEKFGTAGVVAEDLDERT